MLAMMPVSDATLIGHWAFDEGSGVTAGDSSPGGANPGAIANATWGSDSTRSSYLVFNGSNAIVDPSLTLPVMTSANDFTWAFWANSQEAIGQTQQNAIMVGNRHNGAGTNTDFAPRQFIKFTPRQFEWHQEGNGADNLDVPDLVVGEWHHHAIVKTGNSLQYFFDGMSVGSVATLSQAPGIAQHPFFIGGEPGAGGNEYFNGYLDDVRIYDQALSASEVLALAIPESSSLLLSVFGFMLLGAIRRSAHDCVHP